MSATASQMDYVLPNELVDGMILAGGKKATVSIKNLLIRGFYSGAILGLAVILALTVGILTKLPFVGSLLFPFGFASIVLFGMELVTGNFALLPMATWAGKCSGRQHFRNWTWVWIGNFIGTLVVAIIMAISLTSGSMDASAENVGPPIWDLVAQKIVALNQINVVKKYEALGSMGFFLAFLRGVVANWLVCLRHDGSCEQKCSRQIACLLVADYGLPNDGHGAHCCESISAYSWTNPWFRSSFLQSDFLEFPPGHLGKHCWRNGVYRHALLQHPSHQNFDVLPVEHDEKLERELAAELGAR